MRKARLEVERFLGGPQANAEVLARYIGARMPQQRASNEQSRLVFWGIQVPMHRRAAKANYSFSHLKPEEQWNYWLEIWRSSNVFDVKSVALVWIGDPKRKALRLKNFRALFALARDVDNWAHSDGLSALLAELLEQRPELLPRFRKWNKSRHPWLRRQSIVGIYCYARLRKRHVPVLQVLPLVEALLDDPHFYVQRAVGWTLREVDRVDSRKQRAFVRRNLKRIGATAWYATSELYPVAMRKKLVNLRKKT